MEVEIKGLKCDRCDYRDDDVPFSEYEISIDKPCPVCGTSLLTEEEYKHCLHIYEEAARIAEVLGDVGAKENDGSMVSLEMPYRKLNIKQLNEIRGGSLVKVIPQLSDQLTSDGGGFVVEPVRMPPGAEPVSINQYLYFGRVDGMYSVCYTMAGETVYPAGWTEVELVDVSYANHSVVREIVTRGQQKDEQGFEYIVLSKRSDKWVENYVAYCQSCNQDATIYTNEIRYRKELDISIPE